MSAHQTLTFGTKNYLSGKKRTICGGKKIYMIFYFLYISSNFVYMYARLIFVQTDCHMLHDTAREFSKPREPRGETLAPRMRVLPFYYKLIARFVKAASSLPASHRIGCTKHRTPRWVFENGQGKSHVQFSRVALTFLQRRRRSAV